MRRPSLTIAIDPEHRQALNGASAATGASFGGLCRALLDNLNRPGWEEFSGLQQGLEHFWEEERLQRERQKGRS